MRVFVTSAVLMCFFLIAFAFGAKNQTIVSIDYLVAEASLEVSLALSLAFFLGFLGAWIFTFFYSLKLKLKITQLESALNKAKTPQQSIENKANLLTEEPS